MGGIDYLDLPLHDIPHRHPSRTWQSENLLSQSAFGVDVDQQGTYSHSYERSRKDNSFHHFNHTSLKTKLVDLVEGEALFMRNIEHASDRMDIDTKGVPEFLDPQPMPTVTPNDPHLYLPGPTPIEGIGETVTTYLSPPRHVSRPRSRLDSLIRIQNGLGSEESEESSSEESISSTEGCPIPVHPISGGGEWTMLPDIFPPQFPHSPPPSASQPKRKVRCANLIPGRSSIVRERRFGTVPKERAKEPLILSSQQPNPEKPQTEPVLPTQYHLIENIPVVLPRVPCAITRARRLLLPSHESQPIAWVSMRGDTQWVDPEGR
jgi:hypothetical protein